MIDTQLTILFLSGFLGGGHCIGMCGGLVSAMSLHRAQDLNYWISLLCYNIGRITSYVVIGALLGGFAQALLLPSPQSFRVWLTILANLFIITMGLYITGLASINQALERLGTPFWRQLQPYLTRLFPITTFRAALIAGALWGWLPCGLVYTASLSALATGKALDGALVMLAFGLGTLPNLLLMGFFAEQLKYLLQKQWLRLIIGLTIILIGFGQLFMNLKPLLGL